MKKKIIALIMAGIMCIPFAGCGKENKKVEKTDKYNAVQQAVIEHAVADIVVTDEAIYGIYNDIGENTDEFELKNGIIKYDIASKKVSEKEIDTSSYIDIIYKNNEEQLVIRGVKYVEDENAEPSLDVEKEVIYCNMQYIYDKELNQLSESQSDPIIESNDDTSMEDMETDTIVTKEQITVSINVNMMNENYSIKIKDKDGNEKSEIKLDNMADGLYYLDGGMVLCGIWENENQYLYEIDINNGKLGKQIADISKYYINRAYKGKDNKMMFASGTNLFEVDCDTGKIHKILNFIDCDIDADNVNYILYLSDGTLCVILADNNYTSTEIDYLYKRDENEKQKTELTVGVLYLDNRLKEKVISYNKSHNDVRFKIKEYYGEDEEDYDKAISKFNSDIASGNCPDIIDFGSSMVSMQQYIEKDLIEDLTPYFDKDEEINIEDFVQSVVETYKVNGKLYGLPEGFMVDGFYGATSVVGDNIGWTLDEFLQIVNKFEKGTEITSYMTREGIIELLCNCNMSEYVDWSKGECYFDKEDFVKILELSSNYISSEEFFENIEEDDVSEVTKIRNKQQILFNANIADCDDYMVAKEIFGEDITFKGYPSSEGNGTTVSSSGGSLLAISSKSKYKDEAWEFIRQSYFPLGENDDMYGLPIRQKDLDALLEKAKTPVKYIDENGNEQVESFNSSWLFEDVEINVPYPTDKDIAEIKEIINSIDTLSDSNEKIMEMINEEAEAFYKGQKSAEEVAKIIQSRVSVYVKENR